MPGMASTVSVLCVRPSLCHVFFFFVFFLKNLCFVLTSYQVLLCFLLLEIRLVCFKLF